MLRHKILRFNICSTAKLCSILKLRRFPKDPSVPPALGHCYRDSMNNLESWNRPEADNGTSGSCQGAAGTTQILKPFCGFPEMPEGLAGEFVSFYLSLRAAICAC